MADNDNGQQGIQTVAVDDKNGDVGSKRSWECSHTNFDGNSGGAVSPSSVDAYEDKINSSEIDLEGKGVDHEVEVASVENPQKKFVPTLDGVDEVVVDVSPNGHSLISLESLEK